MNGDTVQLCSGTEFESFSILNNTSPGVTYQWSVLPTPANLEIFQADSSSALFSLYASPVSDTLVVTATALSPNVIGSCPDQNSTFVLISTANVVDTLAEQKIIKKEPGHMLMYLDNTVDSYQWGYDDTLDQNTPHIFPGEVFQVYTHGGDGLDLDTTKYYWVTVTKNGCVSKIYFGGKYGRYKKFMEGSADDVKLDVIPNPNNGLFHIFGNIYGNIDEIIYNSLGELVYSRNVNKTEDLYQTDLDLQGMAPGVYTIHLNTPAGERFNIRFVIN
jgi:hypothetical protein